MSRKRDDADAVRIAMAHTATVEMMIHVGRSQMSDQAKRDLAFAYAMGVLHGCCGPNGDFTS